MRVFLIARFPRRAEMRLVAADLRAMGHAVVSEWIEVTDSASDEEFLAWASDREIAQEALEGWQDLRCAGMAIVFSDPPGTYGGGGRHVELGLAVAWCLRLLLVGPREHIYHYLPTVRHFEDWSAARAYLAAEKASGNTAGLTAGGESPAASTDMG